MELLGCGASLALIWSTTGEPKVRPRASPLPSPIFFSKRTTCAVISAKPAAISESLAASKPYENGLA